ncbi:hypothetical protein L9F63_014541 [Diploptera punctata]|uniref:Protein-lysine N-methyltransferase SMYD4 n=1 Tax=Diploptera punctata TaxID=6984 RepID=A0AAD8EKJ2_DIPPU|nr:hypothetical protein L9F63_014541 [Diploptera punctata]
MDPTNISLFNVVMPLVKKGVYLSLDDEFKKVTKNSERVKYATDILKRYNLLPDERIMKVKSLEKSLELKNSGNRAFVQKDDKEALLLYTKSIAAAPIPTEQDLSMPVTENANDALAIAFANRSAVLFRLEKYNLCLQDISQALKYNYPNKLQYKLFERQGKCLQHLGRKKDAMNSINNALKGLSSAELAEDRRQQIKGELVNLLKSYQSAIAFRNLPRDEEPQLPKCSYNRNIKLPCASGCVEIKYSPEMGRYMSATRDIKVGDILVVEKPFASELESKYFETHCYKCMRRCEALLPCSFCSLVMYCSEECRSSCWDESHYIGCSILPTLQNLDIFVKGYLALKIVVKACKTNGIKSLLESLAAQEKLEEIKRGFNNKGVLSSSDYSPIHWLTGHTEKLSLKLLFSMSLNAACILHCLETMTDFFSDMDVDECKYEVGGLLLQHILSLQINSHAVEETLYSTENYLEPGSFRKNVELIGCAVHAVLSLVNHSCDPNVIRTTHREDISVLRAVKPIARGEQVFDCYQFHFFINEKEERKTHYETFYHFTCKCTACTEDWPTLHSLPDVEPTFICNRCKQILPIRVTDLNINGTVTCESCKKIHRAKTFIDICIPSQEQKLSSMKAVRSKNKKDWVDYGNKVIARLHLMCEYTKQPFRLCYEVQHILQDCLRLSGNSHAL